MACYFVDVDGARFQVINPIGERMYQEGETVTLTIQPGDCVLLDADGRRIA